MRFDLNFKGRFKQGSKTEHSDGSSGSVDSNDFGLFDVDRRVIVGREIVIAERRIWPVQMASIIQMGEDRALVVSIKPIAMMIIEPQEQYALTFEGEQMSIEKILEIAPSLNLVLDEALKGRRIEVESGMKYD